MNQEFPVTVFKYQCKCTARSWYLPGDGEVKEASGYYSHQDRVTTKTIDEISTTIQRNVQKQSPDSICDCRVVGIMQLFNSRFIHFQKDRLNSLDK